MSAIDLGLSIWFAFTAVSVALLTVMMLGSGIALAAKYGNLSMRRSPPSSMTMVTSR
jgi:hypothetical protein